MRNRISKSVVTVLAAVTAAVVILSGPTKRSVNAEESAEQYELLDEEYDYSEDQNTQELSEAAQSTSSGELKFRQAVANETVVKAYVRGGSAQDGIAYQIGYVPADEPKAYSIAEDAEPMRTLIMMDNSLSVPQTSREKIRETVTSLIDAHAEKEAIRLATFDETAHYLSDTYSTDYTLLKSLVGTIVYQNQETFLTDVLDEVVRDLNQESYLGYTRIVVISDGVDNKPRGILRDELNAQLTKTLYPIYTIGTATGSNNAQLEGMFALSRLTDSEYFVLEETEVGEITSALSKDGSITVYEAVIPKDAKTGGRQSSKLTLSDGSSIVFDVTMPFDVRTEPEPAPAPEVTPIPEPEPASIVVEEPVEEPSRGNIPLVIGLTAAATAIGAVILALLLRRKKKKSPKGAPGQEIERNETVVREASETIVSGHKAGGAGGFLPNPGAAQKKYRLILTDRKDPSRSYRNELSGPIRIGREAGQGNDILLSNDPEVGRKPHCKITNKNGRIFIQDEGSRNGTFVDGQQIVGEKEIFSGNTIRVGQTELIVKIEQV